MVVDAPSTAGPGAASATRWLRLELTFDGTDFLGWQRQAEGRTVQAEVERALSRILGSPHTVVGGGRTDAGVHARGMVASLVTTHMMPAAELERALDGVLPPDVGVVAVGETPPGFHALRDARWKWYRYTLLLTQRRDPRLRRTTWHVRTRLDRAVLDAGASALIGRHDFRALASLGSPRKTTVRTLHAARWVDGQDALLHFDVVGDGFLYKMVRSIVGTLVEWARNPARLAALASVGSVTAHAAEATGAAIERLLASGDRAQAGTVAPARGLSLMATGLADGRTVGSLPPFPLPRVESVRPPSSGALS